MLERKFHYKDGGEKKLRDIVLSDSFDEDKSWMQYRDTWNIFYHLTPERGNLFNWGLFQGESNLNILEVGSGCGAITAALAQEKAINSITCIEGEESRSEIAKIRLKDHGDKIKHINQNMFDYKPEALFDVVIAVGVLEYSGKYNQGTKPYSDFLNCVKSFLKPGGKLILAIENQLGHKYLAGADEDHYQRPYIGISDYQFYDGIRTFSKSHLIEKIDNSGLKHHKFYYPFPDYKLPKIILSDKAFQDPKFDWLTLFDFPTDQHTKRPNYKFNEKAFLELLKDNVDPGVFMNSFLIVASDEEIEDANENLLAAKVNTTRYLPYRSVKRFEHNQKGEIEVVESNFVNEEKVTSSYYNQSENLGSLLVDAILREDVSRLQEYLVVWRNLLEEKIVVDYGGEQSSIQDLWKDYTHQTISNFYNSSKKFVESKALDLIPNNILKVNNQYVLIDLEWEIPCKKIPLDLVIDRGLYWMINKVLRVSGKSGNPVEDGKWNVSPKLQSVLKVHDHKSLELFESWFQSYACTGENEAKKDLQNLLYSQALWHVKLKKYFKQILKRQLNHLKKSRIIVRFAKLITE